MFNDCLYFNLSSLSRSVTEVCREEFSRIGLSPSHGYLLFAMVEKRGLGQKEYGEILDLEASTINRLVDTLVARGFVDKEGAGKGSTISVTDDAVAEYEKICEVMSQLKGRLQNALGKKDFAHLVKNLSKARVLFDQKA
ncbi:MarR family winged helix-turn-helix transcriptional regulator [Roseibacillus persicicus]|uniref:MarR family winged helix-turn-helix transcriptional regulator n=1 Tax=Roseibacillus persicicus TaxID=454148 RepID=UPI00398AF928